MSSLSSPVFFSTTFAFACAFILAFGPRGVSSSFSAGSESGVFWTLPSGP